MMSLNFEHPVNNEVESLIRKAFAEQIEAADKKTFLLNSAPIFGSKAMKEITNAAKQPVTMELNPIGSVKEMSDGSRYEVTATGWKKLAA